LKEFEFFATLEGHENEVKSVSWDSSGTLIATCGRDKTVWIWTADDQSDFDCLEVLNGHTQDVKSVLWHPTREMLISASYDDTIRCWTEEVDEWTCANILRGHTSTVWSLALNKEGTRLASCSEDLSVVIWKLVDRDNTVISADKAFEWKQVSKITGAHKRTIYDLSWSSDETKDFLATACGDDALRVFGKSKDTEEFVELATVQHAHETDINSVAWNPVNTNMLATASDDHTIKIWKFI
jgi:WD40 repeat protein